MKVLVAIGALVLLLALWAGGTYFNIVRLDEEVGAKVGGVRVVEQRRYDNLTNQMAAVRGIFQQERAVFIGVTEARARVGQMLQVDPAQLAADPELQRQFLAAQQQYSGALGRLLVTVENYPELRSSESVLALQATIEGSENRIANERRLLQEVTARYNVAIRGPMGSFWANQMGLARRDYFETQPGAEQAPQIDLSLDAPQVAPATP